MAEKVLTGDQNVAIGYNSTVSSDFPASYPYAFSSPLPSKFKFGGCNYCGTKPEWTKTGHCPNCGAPKT